MRPALPGLRMSVSAADISARVPQIAAASARPRVLIAASDATTRAVLSRHIIKQWPIATVTACNDSGPMLARKIHALHSYDIILVAIDFAARSDCWDAGGLSWLRDIGDAGVHPPIVIVAESGSEYSAVQAMAAGAADYLPQSLLSGEFLISRVQALLGDPQGNTSERMRNARRTAAQMGLNPYGYQLLDCLDYSGRSAVFLARSRELKREVVLKALCTDEGALTLDPEYLRFAREFSLISYFDHPAVAGIFEFKANRRYCYIAMEYFARGDLRARMREPLPEGEALRLFGALLDSLELVHEAGIVHRDLKPSNVMLRDDQRVALIDFGLARELDDFAELTVAGEVRGTPYYMSPEQAQGEAADERSDLYSTGIVFHELLTGHKPYRGNTAPAILEQHVSSPVPVLPDAWKRFQPVLERLLAKSADARFQRVGELRAALRPLLA